MKVLNVNSYIDLKTGGGTAERTLMMSRALSLRNIECKILSTNSGISKSLIKQLKPIDIFLTDLFLKRYFIPLVRWKTIKNIVGDADIIHLMGHWSILNALVYIAARRLDKPYVVCPAGALKIFGRSRFLKNLYNFIIGRNIIKNASAWIAVTSGEFSQFRSYGILSAKIKVIPNGISVSSFPKFDEKSFRRHIGFANKPIILFMGRLNEIKGPDLLLKAFILIHKQISEFHLVFAGPDEGMKSILINIAEQNNLSKYVHFLGYIEGAEKSAVYKMANLLVVPSRQEAMSIVALEAASFGIPVMLTEECGFSEIKSICPDFEVSADVLGIAHGLIKLLSDQEKLRHDAVLLKEFVVKTYEWNSLVLTYIDLYKKILTSQKK